MRKLKPNFAPLETERHRKLRELVREACALIADVRSPLLSAKQLAAVLGRSTRYVYSMRARGFPMPGGTATVSEARAWLANHPKPCATDRKPSN